MMIQFERKPKGRGLISIGSDVSQARTNADNPIIFLTEETYRSFATGVSQLKIWHF